MLQGQQHQHLLAEYMIQHTDTGILQEMRVLLEPMTIMFASKGYKLDDVVQEVRRMQTQWQHSDYRAWLKHYTTGKRPRSAMEDSKQLLRHDGGDTGAGPRDIGKGWASCLPGQETAVTLCHPAVVHDVALGADAMLSTRGML